MRTVLALSACVLAASAALPLAGASAADTGVLDPSYGTGGTVALSSPTRSVGNALLAGQGTATLVAVGAYTYDQVAGTWTSSLYVQRRDASGALDPAFGTDGESRVPFPAGAALRDLSTLPDGRVVLLASVSTSGFYEDQQVAVARLLADGRPDPTFGAGGTVLTDLRARHLLPRVVLPGADGSVLVGLDQDVRGTGGDVAVARYDAAGRLDPGYGTGGVATVDLGADDHLTDLVADGTGRPVALATLSGTADEVGLVRLTTDGHRDRTFGRGGALTFSPGAGATAGSLVVGAGGLVVTGTVRPAPGVDASYVAKLLPQGRLDKRFGAGGLAMLDAPGALESIGPVQLVGGTLVFLRSVGDGPFASTLQEVDATTGAPVGSFGVGGTVELPDFQGQSLLADGSGTLLSGVAFGPDGPAVVLQRRR